MLEDQLERQLAALFSDAVIPEPEPLPAPGQPGRLRPPAQPPAAGAVPATPALQPQAAPGPPDRSPAVEPVTRVNGRAVARRVLLMFSDSESARLVSDYFTRQGSQVWQAANLAQARSLLEQHQPRLVVADWGASDVAWLSMLREIRRRFPGTKLLLTNSYRDARLVNPAQSRTAVMPPPLPPARAAVVAAFPAPGDTPSQPGHAAFPVRAEVVPVFPAGDDTTLSPARAGCLARLASRLEELLFGSGA